MSNDGAVPIPDSECLSFRLIVCNTSFQGSQSNNVSFTEQHFTRLMANLHFPGEFLQAILTGTPVILRLEDGDDSTPVYMMRTPLSNSENWTIALRFDPEANTTFAIIHGLQEKEYQRLLHELAEYKNSSVHPMLFPCLLCELLTEADSDGIKRLATGLFNVENKTIWHGYWQTGKENELAEDRTPEHDFEYLTRTLNYITSRLAFHEMRINANIALILKLRQYLQHERDTWYNLMKDEESQIMIKMFTQRLSSLQTEHDALLLEVACNQKIAAGQLQIVYNLIAQHDNKENLRMAATSTQIAAITKDDSFATRTIAIMTVAFLPATAISSLFSMGMFNWQADPDDTVLSGRFWIYWVVAVPLTLIVLALWFAWVHSHKKHEGKQFSWRNDRPSTEAEEGSEAEQAQSGLLTRIPRLRRRVMNQQHDDEIKVGSSARAAEKARTTSRIDHLHARANTFVQGPLR